MATRQRLSGGFRCSHPKIACRSKRSLIIAFMGIFFQKSCAKEGCKDLTVRRTSPYDFSYKKQGHNEVYFCIAHPVNLPKFLIPGSKRDENFNPLSRKILLIQNAWSLIQWKTPLIPIPGVVILDPGAVIPDPTLFFCPWSLIPYTSLRPLKKESCFFPNSGGTNFACLYVAKAIA